VEKPIGQLSQIPLGEGRNFALGELRVAVFHTSDGRVFATQADCPHKGGPLADGLTDTNSVVCPLHDRAYDFHTGAGIGNACSIRVYPIRATEDGTLLLQV
jgi:nitrite reductase (NADH) small subunit